MSPLWVVVPTHAIGTDGSETAAPVSDPESVAAVCVCVSVCVCVCVCVCVRARVSRPGSHEKRREDEKGRVRAGHAGELLSGLCFTAAGLLSPLFSLPKGDVWRHSLGEAEAPSIRPPC